MPVARLLLRPTFEPSVLRFVLVVVDSAERDARPVVKRRRELGDPEWSIVGEDEQGLWTGREVGDADQGFVSVLSDWSAAARRASAFFRRVCLRAPFDG